MSDATGTVVWRANYLPFGEETIDQATVQNNKMFVGKEKDSESGLYYFGARYNDSTTGRFISVDSMGPVDPQTGEVNQIILHDPQRFNRYAYGLNNPYKYIDPDGKLVGADDALVIYLAVGLLGAMIIQAAGKTLQASNSSEVNKHRETSETSSDSNTNTTSERDQRMENAPGQTANGQATDEYGNKLGPSGKPMVNRVKHSSPKEAKDPARNEGKGSPEKHQSPKIGDPHYHPADEQGEKIPGGTHHEY
jgi:RHS repeat-associated protein